MNAACFMLHTIAINFSAFTFMINCCLFALNAWTSSMFVCVSCGKMKCVCVKFMKNRSTAQHVWFVMLMTALFSQLVAVVCCMAWKSLREPRHQLWISLACEKSHSTNPKSTFIIIICGKCRTIKSTLAFVSADWTRLKLYGESSFWCSFSRHMPFQHTSSLQNEKKYKKKNTFVFVCVVCLFSQFFSFHFYS